MNFRLVISNDIMATIDYEEPAGKEGWIFDGIRAHHGHGLSPQAIGAHIGDHNFYVKCNRTSTEEHCWAGRQWHPAHMGFDVTDDFEILLYWKIVTHYRQSPAQTRDSGTAS